MTADAVRVDAVPYRRLTRDELRRLKHATQQLGAFLNVPATLGPFGKRTRGSLV